MYACGSEWESPNDSSSSSSSDADGNYCLSYYVVELVVQLCLIVVIGVEMTIQIRRMRASEELMKRDRVGVEMKRAAYWFAMTASLVRVIRCSMVLAEAYNKDLMVFLVFLPFLMLNSSFSLMLTIWLRVLTNSIPLSKTFLYISYAVLLILNFIDYFVVLVGAFTTDTFRNQECQIVLSSFAILFACILFLIGRKIRNIGKSKEVRLKNVVDNVFNPKGKNAWQMYTIIVCMTFITICFMTIFILHKTTDTVHEFITKKYIIIWVEVSRDTIILMFLHKKRFKPGHTGGGDVGSINSGGAHRVPSGDYQVKVADGGY